MAVLFKKILSKSGQEEHAFLPVYFTKLYEAVFYLIEVVLGFFSWRPHKVYIRLFIQSRYEMGLGCPHSVYGSSSVSGDDSGDGV